jgi:carbohydrate-binding DOMON domain-containing protein
MSTQYRLVQSGKTASGGCSAGQGSSEPVAPRIYYLFIFINFFIVVHTSQCEQKAPSVFHSLINKSIFTEHHIVNCLSLYISPISVQVISVQFDFITIY